MGTPSSPEMDHLAPWLSKPQVRFERSEWLSVQFAAPASDVVALV